MNLGLGYFLELQGPGSMETCFDISGLRSFLCENFKSIALVQAEIVILKNINFQGIQALS